MQHIIDGVFHWTALNEQIGSRVSSYYVGPADAVIDPKVPEDGFDALPGRPEQVLLTSGHHLRDAQRFAEHFGIPIRALKPAAEYIEDDVPIDVITAGEQAAPGISAIHVGVISDDECALHIAHGAGALAVADAVNRRDGELAFFPDSLLGDDPEAVKDGLRTALARLATEHAFEALLFAHGEPLASGGTAALQRFAAS
jgi:hypothetical protein